MIILTDRDTEGFLISHSRWQKIRKPVISLFISFHLILIVLWIFPIRFAKRDYYLDPFKNYVLFIGLNQDYEIMAPKPRDRNLHLVAVVTHADGTLELWEYPRLERMNFIERLYKERFRKYAHDRVAWEPFESFLPDLARYIARLNNKPGNPPVHVSLVRYSARIPVPPVGFKQGDLPPQSDTDTIITYTVTEADLK